MGGFPNQYQKGLNMAVSLFEKIITSFIGYDQMNYLDACMSLNVKEIRLVPLRYRLIALGFVRNMTLDDLNEKLQENGLDRLYARNYTEASLIYAFANGLSYQEWRSMMESPDLTGASENVQSGRYFTEGSIRVSEIRRYVTEESLSGEENDEDQKMRTSRLTRLLDEQIRRLPAQERAFVAFMKQNTMYFSTVREKTRYYFCKYLLFYIDRKTEQYITAVKSGFGKEQALAGLSILKNVTKLKRKNYEEKEIRELTETSSISAGNLYDEFNYYYFEYISDDWADVLMDLYGCDLNSLTGKERTDLAESLRRANPKWRNLNDHEVLSAKQEEMEAKERELDRIYSLDNPGGGYQRNRSGENSVRNYIKGTLDIDRISLICYLLFFAQEGMANKGMFISRLNQILDNCGFSGLQKENDFDYFVLRYLQSDDPAEILMDTVTKWAKDNRNFYLYHMYKESFSNEEQLKRLLNQ